MWRQLHRDGHPMAQYTVERFMRAAGLRGVMRGRQFRTTRQDPATVRATDPVRRDFSAGRPNGLWPVDFT
jgi:putative transposase